MLKFLFLNKFLIKRIHINKIKNYSDNINVYITKKRRNLYITLTKKQGEVIFHISNSMVGFKKFRLRNDRNIIHLLIELFFKKLYKFRITNISNIILRRTVLRDSNVHIAVLKIFLYQLRKRGIKYKKTKRYLHVAHSSFLFSEKKKLKDR
jgi:hypothetical protein